MKVKPIIIIALGVAVAMLAIREYINYPETVLKIAIGTTALPESISELNTQSREGQDMYVFAYF